MQKGQIRVQTENIFPIIKKFLYSDHEIFLRELVSNAIDATQKLKTLSSIGEAKGDLNDLRIDVVLNVEEKTLSIIDKGVGMTAEEVDKYLNQLAFSGAEEFLSKYKDANIIGHFGLGFYSAFMVSDKVEVFTKSFREGATGVYWSCDGSPEFELNEIEKEERGTRIVLHINEDSAEFLDGYRIRGILEKFCRFLPVPIFFSEEGVKEEEKDKELEEKPINNPNPIWVRKPSELTTEDYQNFYKELYPMGETPLFWIHLNVDFPFNLTGILYFPKIKQSYEIQKDKIQLYSNQVFVTDEVKDIVPEFLMLLHGVIDSPDIPLNVSRSYLQGDPNVKKINAHITKKVADKLDEMFRNERNSFEEKWDSLGLFVKYGMMTDDKFLDKGNKFLLLQDTADKKFYTLEEYKTAVEAVQKNKDGKTVIIYTTDPVQQDGYIKAAQGKDYKVVKLETLIDNAFINQMEMKWDSVHFVRVDSDIADNLVDVQEHSNSVLSGEEEEKLKGLFGFQVPDLTLKVEVKGLSADSAPVIATRPEFMRRMKDMAGMGGGGMSAFYANMPDEVTLTVNGNHKVYQTLLKEVDTQKQENQIRNLADLALLSQGLLKGASLTEFINRSVALLS
ncbi:molecular chaperone HtpG [Filimonas zeae]|uniref:Chaperone protein HtpG n=1 Tax=Filimonas zeae TaxID=1737353 RepID=A0A917J365_9BACT|nr:molecular chaperone HtpG [Filimonas zeae]MDR6341682.1 molecular chaperone HtpG [Filimonas zeae]GGH74673.1 chaperone protein htpG [Filimonas zeae]